MPFTANVANPAVSTGHEKRYIVSLEPSRGQSGGNIHPMSTAATAISIKLLRARFIFTCHIGEGTSAIMHKGSYSLVIQR